MGSLPTRGEEGRGVNGWVRSVLGVGLEGVREPKSINSNNGGTPEANVVLQRDSHVRHLSYVMGWGDGVAGVKSTKLVKNKK